MKNLLFKKVYGALIGSAIGDALGGPVEFWSPSDIESVHGRVSSLLPYAGASPSPHGPWSLEPGSYTDDSRLSKILCGAAVEAGRSPTSGDVRCAFVRSHHDADTELAKAFIEEYAFKALYGEEKQIFGGQPTNAGVMAIAPFGVLAPCDPFRALSEAFSSIFYVEGYARYSAAFCAAAVSAAMKPESDPKSIVADSLEAIRRHKAFVEGPLWAGDPMYDGIGRKNENLVLGVCELARRHMDTTSIREELLALVAQPFGADGAESMAVGIAMFIASGGDYRGTVEGCVGFGRDNDSSASFGGALAGAYGGIERIPAEWVEQVERVNPPPTFRNLALDLCTLIEARHRESRQTFIAVERLL